MRQFGKKFERTGGQGQTPQRHEQERAIAQRDGQERAVVRKEATPMDKYKDRIIETFSQNETFVFTGETGSGKTTRGPLFFLEALQNERGPDARIAVTVPRPNIATTVAPYVAQLGDYTMGKEVGYQIRFDNKTNKDTNLNFVTDGIMLRKITADPTLKNLDAVMVDEAHERSLNIDMVLGLLKRAQKLREKEGLPPLKIIVASATIEKEKFANYFETDATEEIEGRMFPVEEKFGDYSLRESGYQERRGFDYTEAAAKKCSEILEETKEGDILVFMPGRREIENTVDHLEGMEFDKEKVEILSLHSAVSKEEQTRVLSENAKKRRIVVSTNIAEAGVTVHGVQHVVDSGLIKETYYDPDTGIESLLPKAHSRSGLTQRKGRAGRLAEGTYHALYSKDSRDTLEEYSKPEIQRTNLTHVALLMKKNGINNIREFDFIDKPDTWAINKAIEELTVLGALDAEENITPIGLEMVNLPLDPKKARMVIEAQKLGCEDDVITALSFLEGKSVFLRPKGKEYEADLAQERFKDPRSDFITYLNVWKKFREENAEGRGQQAKWAKQHFLRTDALWRARDTRAQILRALGGNGRYANKIDDSEAVGKAIAAGLVPSLMQKGYRHSYNYIDQEKSGRSNFHLFPGSSVFGTNPEFCVAGEIFKPRDKTWLSLVQTVKPEWIPEIAPQMVTREREDFLYNPEEDEIQKRVKYRIKNSYATLAETSEPIPKEEEEQAVQEFAHYLTTSSAHTIDFVRHNSEVEKQYNELLKRNGGEIEENLLFSGARLSEVLVDIYAKVLKQYGNIRSIKGLEEIGTDMRLKLEDLVQKEVQERIKRENPDTISLFNTEFTVQYGEKNPVIRIKKEEIENGNWKKLPDEGIFLPGGKKVGIIHPFTSIYSQYDSTDTQQVKEEIRKNIEEEMWKRWNNYEKPKISPPNIKDEGVEIPFLTEIYGKSALTGEDLTAYGTVQLEKNLFSNDFFPRIEWYKNEQSAKRIYDETINKLENWKEAKQKEKELLTAKTEVQEAREALKELTTNTDWYSLDYDFRDEIRKIILKNSGPSLEDIRTYKKEMEEYIELAQGEIENFKEIRKHRETMLHQMKELEEEHGTPSAHFIVTKDGTVLIASNNYTEVHPTIGTSISTRPESIGHESIQWQKVPKEKTLHVTQHIGGDRTGKKETITIPENLPQGFWAVGDRDGVFYPVMGRIKDKEILPENLTTFEQKKREQGKLTKESLSGLFGGRARV